MLRLQSVIVMQSPQLTYFPSLVSSTVLGGVAFDGGHLSGPITSFGSFTAGVMQEVWLPQYPYLEDDPGFPPRRFNRTPSNKSPPAAQ